MLATILISILLAAVVVLILIYQIRQHRKGNPDDCAGCSISSCPYSHPSAFYSYGQDSWGDKKSFRKKRNF